MDLETLQLGLAKDRLADLDRVARVAAFLDSLLAIFKANRDESVGCVVPREEATLVMRALSVAQVAPPPPDLPVQEEKDAGSRMVAALLDAVLRRMKAQHGVEPLRASLTTLANFFWPTNANSYPVPFFPVLITEFLQHSRDGLTHLLSKT